MTSPTRPHRPHRQATPGHPPGAPCLPLRLFEDLDAVRTEFDHAGRLQCRDEEAEVLSEQPESSSLPMLPVATISSRRGDARSRWLSRKSPSLVTRTRSSASAASATVRSVLRLASGRSSVCMASCPATASARASRGGSCASTRNFTQPAESAGSLQLGRRTQGLLGRHPARDPDSQPAPGRPTCLRPKAAEDPPPDTAARESPVCRVRSPGLR